MSGKRFVILTASEQLPAKLAVASLPAVEMLGEQFTNQLTLSVVNVFPLISERQKATWKAAISR